MQSQDSTGILYDLCIHNTCLLLTLVIPRQYYIYIRIVECINGEVFCDLLMIYIPREFISTKMGCGGTS